MNHWDSILSVSIIWKFLGLLQPCLHEIGSEYSFSFPIKNSWTNDICLELWFDSPCSHTEGLNRFDFFIWGIRFPQSIILILKSDVSFLLLSITCFRFTLYLCIGFFNWILISLFIFPFFFLFGLGLCPGHHMRHTNQYLITRELVQFESRNHKLCFLQIASIEIIDYHIRIQNYFLEEFHFPRLRLLLQCLHRLVCGCHQVRVYQALLCMWFPEACVDSLDGCDHFEVSSPAIPQRMCWHSRGGIW